MSPFAAGQTLGRYRLDAVLGRGGMAEVFRATDTRLGRVVAVKVILGTYALEPEFVARFLREARLVAGLEHPHIVPVYDFGEEQGVPYLVMPFLAGGTLADRMTSAQPLPGALVTGWVEGLASALDAAHHSGVLHRDVKPGNVLLANDDRALLADFGIAKMHESATRLTTTGMVVGTPLYMAPELAAGGEAAPATDAYALAVLAFEAVTGAPPFRGSNALALLHQHVHTPPPRPSAQSPGLPAALDPVFERALAKTAPQRFPDCRAFATALCAALGAVPSRRLRDVPAIPVTARTRALADRETTAVGSIGSRWPLIAAAAGLALVAWLLWPRPEPPATPQAPEFVPAPIEPAARTPVESVAAPPAQPPAAAPAPRPAPPPASSPVAPAVSTPSETPDVESELSLERLGVRGIDHGPRRLARSDFEKLLATASRRSGGARPAATESAEVYARGGLAYVDGDLGDARAAIERLLAGEVGSFPLLENLIGGLRSFAATGLEDWHVALAYGDARREAESLLGAYEAAHSGDPSVQVGRAVLAVIEGDPRRALGIAQAAYRLSPKPRLAAFVAQQHLATGALDESLRWWETAAAGEGAEAGFAALQGARVARQLGKGAKARELQEIACARGVRTACLGPRRQRPGQGLP